MKKFLIKPAIFLLVVFLFPACKTEPTTVFSEQIDQTPLDTYVTSPDSLFNYELVKTEKKEKHTFHVLKMVSQRWLSDSLVEDPVWWHYINVVVPDSITNKHALLWIGGGDRQEEMLKSGGSLLTRATLQTGTVTAEIRNVPNQPIQFVGDPEGGRYEDELIAYGWRKFLESGADDEDAIWLARLPMTKAATSAMDAVEDFVEKQYDVNLEAFVVSGASKRGWTTWTTGITDPRVKAIAPVVIDVLNIVPSFQHHWRAYGRWAPAVNDYVDEGVMDWLNSAEFDRLLDITDPFSYMDRLDMPKYVINSAGDQFFLPDSWKYYYNQLPGEKLLRYVPNSDHSLRRTDAVLSLIGFYKSIINDQDLPDYKWTVKDGITFLRTDPENAPKEIKVWQAYNPEARDFRQETIGDIWESTALDLKDDGTYRIRVETPEEGFRAYFVELLYAPQGVPLKVTTGVVVTPDVYPYDVFQSKKPKGEVEELLMQ